MTFIGIEYQRSRCRGGRLAGLGICARLVLGDVQWGRVPMLTVTCDVYRDFVSALTLDSSRNARTIDTLAATIKT